jgi:peptidoglycan/xylan/chitin deacetylase (PgdA/CDA1 family)
MLRYFRSSSVILLYHRIAEVQPDPWSLCVTPKHFAEHLDVLQKFQRVRLDRLTPGDWSIGGGLNVAITFDDGYADNLYQARRLLEKYDTPATFFIATGAMDRDREFWWDELERIVFQAEDPGSLLNCWQVQAHLSQASEGRLLEGSALREAVYFKLYEQLQPLSHEAREPMLDRMSAASGQSPHSRASHRTLTSAELHRLASGNLFEIGAHTVTHPLLAAQPLSVQEAELANSRQSLEETLGREVSSFSYPYGGRSHYSTATVEAVRRTGFRRACTTEAQAVRRTDDPFEWGRLNVVDMDGDQFEEFLLEHGKLNIPSLRKLIATPAVS